MAESRDESSGPEEPSQPSGGPLRWLINPKRKRFLLPATGVWILVLDWLLFSTNLLSAWLATPIVVVLGFVLGSVGTFMAQRKAANDRSAIAALKALLAGIVVGVPWPLGGTIVGGWVLLTSGLADAKKEILNK